MSIVGIEVKNLLSFRNISIKEVNDINCIVGRNNVGKSNIIKLIDYFYSCLEGKKEIRPPFHSSYTSIGSIRITYNLDHIVRIVSRPQAQKNNYLKRIYYILKDSKFLRYQKQGVMLDIELFIDHLSGVFWKGAGPDLRKLICQLFPLIVVDTRHMNLDNWDELWRVVSRLSSMNINTLDRETFISFIDSSVRTSSKRDYGFGYKDLIRELDDIVKSSKYKYRERILGIIKSGLIGYTPVINDEDIDIQSDGTKSYLFINILLKLVISLTRKEYMSPVVFLDEIEIGLHPKLSERIVENLFSVYSQFRKTKAEKEVGRFRTPYPKIFISSHSQNIVHYLIKKFSANLSIYFFDKQRGRSEATKLRTFADSKPFINKFSELEARLLFSEFILFVEGQTEIDIFNTQSLIDLFPKLKKVDVSQIVTDKVLLRRLDPRYSKIPTPFLILFDSDVFINIDIHNISSEAKGPVKNRFQWKDRSMLNSELSKLKKYYYSSKSDTKKKRLQALINLHNQEITFRKVPFRLAEVELPNLVRFLNRHILRDLSMAAFPSTIEGAIINPKSYRMFKKWLWAQVRDHLMPDPKSNNFLTEIVAATTNDETKRLFRKLQFSTDKIENDVQLLALKAKCCKVALKKLNDSFEEYEDRVNAVRITFKGKSDSLLKRKFFPTDYFEYEYIFDPLKPLLSKTSGWASMFLDFVIEDLAAKNRKNDFQNIFPDLYAIIRVISTSVD